MTNRSRLFPASIQSVWIVAVFVLSILAGVDHASGQAAPSDFVVGSTVVNGGTVQVSLSWTDNSNNEAGFAIYYSINSTNGPWNFIGNAAANQTDASLNYGSAFTTVGSNVVYLIGALEPGGGAVSNYAPPAFTVWPNYSSPTLATPTDLAASFPATNFVRLSWTDNSNSEQYTEVTARDLSVVGSTFQLIGNVDWSVNPLDLYYYFQPGKSYEVRIRVANFSNTFTGYTAPITINIPGSVNDVPPVPPANLTAAAFADGGTLGYALAWDDTSTDEIGFEIQEKLNSEGTWRGLQTVAGDTLTTDLGVGVSYVGHFNNSGNVVAFGNGEIFDFRVRSVRGNGPFRVVSTFATVLGTTQADFNPPTNLRLSAPADNGRVMLFWSDNARTEVGYEIEYRYAGDTTFTPRGSFDSTGYPRIQGSGGVDSFAPSSTVEFRVRAYKAGSTTAYSNVASVTMPPMTPPTNLIQGAPGAEGELNFSWTDNTGNEAAYVVQGRIVAPGTPAATFSDLFFTSGSDVTTALLTDNEMIPGFTYEFQVRAVNSETSTSPLIYSEPSNVITLTPSFNAPTSLQSLSSTDTSVTLTWTDNSSVEHGYFIYSRPGGTTGTPSLIGATAANATSASVALTPGASTEFFVAAFVSLSPSGESVTTQSNGVTVVAKDGMTSAAYLEIHRNEVMVAYNLTTTTTSSVVTRSITGLPAGLTFNDSLGQLTGTPTGTGVFQTSVQVTFADGWTHNNTLVIRILEAPVAGIAIPSQSLEMGTPGSIPLADKFSDPDTTSAMRVNTNLAVNGGNMDFIMYDADTPLHVANFKGYADRGDYVDTVFHRSIAGFISQAGAFRAGAGPEAFNQVTTQAAVTNEPGISNVRGTVALAKLEGNPSSGTNQFFVNLANNGPNLDFQNGGFTVFARVTAPGMALADALATLPTGDYDVTVDGSPSVFADFPINDLTAPGSMDNSLAVKINSVTALPVLAYSITSNSNAGVATVTVVSGSLSVTPVSPGTTSIVVRATDLENRFVEQTFVVTVNNTLANWAATEGLTSGQDGLTDDPDFDGRVNLLEYGLMTSAGTADAGAQPVLGSTVDGADNKATITFKVRKFAALTYTVRSSGNLTGWQPIWTTADGFGAPNVVSAVDNPDHTLVTVKDTVGYTPGSPRFVQIQITSP